MPSSFTALAYSSLSVMSLIHFIEQDLAIDVPAEDVTIENFVSLRTIDAYLGRRLEP